MRVWAYAAAEGFVLVTEDEDVHRLSVLRASPRKVVWVAPGNCTTADVARLFRFRHEEIAAFVAHPEAAFLASG